MIGVNKYHTGFRSGKCLLLSTSCMEPLRAVAQVFLASVSREEAGSSDTAKKPVVWCRAAEIDLKAELQIKRTDSSARYFLIYPH